MSETISTIDRLSAESIQRWEDGPLEIQCGAIWRLSDSENLMRGQANTSKGVWDLVAFKELQLSDAEILEFIKEWGQGYHVPQPRRSWRKTTVVIPAIPSKSVEIISEPPTPVENRISDDTETLGGGRISQDELLTKLDGASISQAELFETILFVEITKFDRQQTEALLPKLSTFISEHRLSQNKNTKTAVGAAIRKLALNLQDTQIEEYADLFLPTETDTLPCEIELELAKAILWRLTAEPASLSSDFPKLEHCLVELASDYLKPRLILQKNYAAVALQAILGILLLNSQHADRIMQDVRGLNINWFSDLLQRRLERLKKHLAKSNDSSATSAVTNLERFVVEIPNATN